MNARLFYLDRLRVFLTALVIVHHTAITYGAGGSWYFEDVDRTEMTISSVVLTLFTAVNQSFFMGLFFFLSGYFTPASYDRKGPGKFLADRFLRLGVPLAVYHFAIGPFVTSIAGRSGFDRFSDFYRADVLSFRNDHFGPLWFVEALLIFALVYTIWRVAARLRETPAQTSVPTDRTLLIAAISLGFAAFAVRLVFPTGAEVLGLQFGYFPSYIALFIAGIAAKRANWLDRLSPSLSRRWARISLAAFPVLPIALILTGALEGNMQFEGGLNVQALVYALWEPFMGFGIMLWLLVRFANRHNAPPSPLQKAQNDAAFGAYVIHPLIVVALSLPLAGRPLPPSLKLLIVGAAAVAASFALSWLLRRIPGASRIL